MLFKNVASQKALAFAYDKTTGAAKTGDAANITGSISKDGGSASATNDTNPTEIGGGWYAFDLTQAETNCDLFLLYSASATSNILVNGVAGYTTGGSIPQAGVAPSATALSTAQWSNTRAGYLDALNGHTAQTGDAFARLGAPAGASISADIATRASQTSVDTVDDLIDTEIAALTTSVAAVKAKTDNLPSDPADASDIATSFSGVDTKLDTIDNFLDTEVAAIKAKTDLIPASPAASGDIPTASAIATAVWGFVVEGSYSATHYMRLYASALLGKLSGAATSTVTIRDTADSKARITATNDENGNRTAVTLDAS